MAYGWLTFANGRAQLAARLADPTNAYWTDAENGLYITESLRVWNALTFTWKTSFVFTIAAASSPTWYSLGLLTGSPRLRTVTDTAVYTLMEYHLLEPATGAVWAGTSQFSIADLSLALQRCRDEAIQLTNCNQLNPAPLASTPNTRGVTLPDTYLDVARVRWMPTGSNPVTLMRNDDTGLNYYQPDYLQTDETTPTQYNIASLPPLTMQVDIAPALPGKYDLIALESGPSLAPPTPALLNVPDDNAWVLKWGALADLLGRESEATDRLRATYCRARYSDGLKLMQNTPWVMQARINDVPADLVSVQEMDQYAPEWDSVGSGFAAVVLCGTDFFTVVPDEANDMSLTLTVLGNAPVPVLNGDFIQCSRDVWDVILDYAQFLAAFKQGGAEFTSSLELEKGFIAAAMAINGRLAKLGLFANEFEQEGQREVRAQERFEGE